MGSFRTSVSHVSNENNVDVVMVRLLQYVEIEGIPSWCGRVGLFIYKYVSNDDGGTINPDAVKPLIRGP